MHTRIFTAILLAFTILAGNAIAQNVNFDFGSEPALVAFKSTDNNYLITLTAEDFVFDDGLAFDYATYGAPQSAMNISSGDAAGYYAPGHTIPTDPAELGYITDPKDNVGLGKYIVKIEDFSNTTLEFTLELTDANILDPNTKALMLFEIYEYNGEIKVRCYTNVEAQTNNECKPVGGSDYFAHDEAMRVAYIQPTWYWDREGFTMQASDYPFAGLQDVSLDVSLEIQGGSLVIPNDHTFRVNVPQVQPITAPMYTDLKFEPAESLEVQLGGSFIADNELGTVYLIPSIYPPQSTNDYWYGMKAKTDQQITLRNVWYQYAYRGMEITDCNYGNVSITNSFFTDCETGGGLTIDNSDAYVYQTSFSHNKSYGCRVTGNEIARFKRCTFANNFQKNLYEPGNGFEAVQDGYAFLDSCYFYYNDGSGVYTQGSGHVKIDTCRIYSNGHAGVHCASGPDIWNTIQESKVYENAFCGLLLEESAMIRGWYSDIDWPEDQRAANVTDDLGHNCIFDNLFTNCHATGPGTVWELGREYFDPGSGTITYLGRDNSLSNDALRGTQLEINDAMHAWFLQDYWNNYHVWTVLNPGEPNPWTHLPEHATPIPGLDCGIPGGGEGGGPSDSTGADKYGSVASVPQTLYLGGAYPNPFNPTTQISFGLPSEQHISLTVFNSLGAEVAKLADGTYDAGHHTVTFSGSNLPSGLYFYVLKAQDDVLTNKVLLMK